MPRPRVAATKPWRKLEKEGIEAKSLVLDVTDQTSVSAAAEALGSQIEALDALVNNAGMHMGFAGPISGESVEDMRQIFDVNAFGSVASSPRPFYPCYVGRRRRGS